MAETSFHQTRMGHRFYESTMPELVKQLARTNELLVQLLEATRATRVPTGPTPEAGHGS